MTEILFYTPSQALPYSWVQQLQDVDIQVPVPEGTRARQLAIKIEKKKISVGLKGQDPIMAGELCQEIKMEDSTWTLGEHIGLPSLNQCL